MRVYMVRLGEAFKVGGSTDPVSRLAAIRSHSPLEPALVLSHPGSHLDEGMLRRLFKREGLHICREWFTWRDDVVGLATEALLAKQFRDAMTPMAISKTHGPMMKRARVARGLTQSQLAQLLGCKQAHVSMAERGKHGLGPGFVTKLEAWFHSAKPNHDVAPRGPYNNW